MAAPKKVNTLTENPVEEGIANVSEPLSTMPEPEKPEKPEEVPSLLDASLEAQVTQLGRETAKTLKKEQQVETLIPIDPLNKHDKFVQVGINGWVFTIQRNTWVKLPASVVDLLENAGYNPSTRDYVPKRSKPFEMPDLKIMPKA
ncbi:MAG: hypothetical protein ACPLQO_02225 [Desulfotomaculales bacterium]